jgi:hypothetical protein
MNEINGMSGFNLDFESILGAAIFVGIIIGSIYFAIKFYKKRKEK